MIALKRVLLIVFSIVTFSSMMLNGQVTTRVLKDSIDKLSGTEKLVVMNQLTQLYIQDGELRKAFRNAKSARILADNIISTENRLLHEDDFCLRPETYLWLGITQYYNNSYDDALITLQVAKKEANDLSLVEIVNEADTYLSYISNESNNASNEKEDGFKKAWRNLGSGINKSSIELNVSANLKLADYHEKNKNYIKAIDYNNKAIALLQNLGDWERIYQLEEKNAQILVKDGQLEEAMTAYKDIEEKVEETGDTIAMRRLEENKSQVKTKIDSTIIGLESVKGERIYSEHDVNKESDQKIEADILKSKAEYAEETEDFELSLNYYKEYMAIEKKMAEEQQAQELALLEKVNEIESREKEITLLKQNEEINKLKLDQNEAALQTELTFKRNLAIGIVLLAFLIILLIILYRNKRKDHKKLGIAYNDLEAAKQDLEKAEKSIKNLLNQQVSGEVADELLSSNGDQPIERRFVCIMFLDIRDFTPFAEKKNPEEIIDYQNQVFGYMIDCITRHKGVVNQIMGDGFMATFGAPISSGNDCLQAYQAANEIIKIINDKSTLGEIPHTRIGIGLHAGHIVAGNVGTKDRKQYSITGNPVIIASRLEQLNKQYGSNLILSKEVYDELPSEHQQTKEFIQVKVKGRSDPMDILVL